MSISLTHDLHIVKETSLKTKKILFFIFWYISFFIKKTIDRLRLVFLSKRTGAHHDFKGNWKYHPFSTAKGTPPIALSLQFCIMNNFAKLFSFNTLPHCHIFNSSQPENVQTTTPSQFSDDSVSQHKKQKHLDKIMGWWNV